MEPSFPHQVLAALRARLSIPLAPEARSSWVEEETGLPQEECWRLELPKGELWIYDDEVRWRPQGGDEVSWDGTELTAEEIAEELAAELS